jgi:hypothetical protein
MLDNVQRQHWINVWTSGEYVPSAVFDQYPDLLKRFSHDKAIWSVKQDAYRKADAA